MNERWRPVVGYEGLYEVSDQGLVRSVDRVVVRRNGRPYTVRGKVLATGDVRGYRKLGLGRGNGTLDMRYVHSLVLEAFVGPRPKGLEAHHINADRADNRLENLRYVTPQENTRHTIEAGRFNYMSGHNRREVPAEVIPLLGTQPDYKLAECFGVEKTLIRRWRLQRGIPSYAEVSGQDGKFRSRRKQIGGDSHSRNSTGVDD